ncbi:MAG: class I SAM-dependent methyltransferase [Bacteroidales bacterium]|nr:class I SAM-dependent methyltransferase [Bacteroidales bacterium]MBK9358725.1 class I SAM-dependent methyltransferase [Bacteroidales bacterium]
MKEQWNERYAAPEYIYGTEPNNWLAGKLSQLSPGSLLLPAEGEGRNAVYAAGLGWDVWAFDQSEEGRRKALNLASLRKTTIRYDIGDLTSFDPGEIKFDVIALIFVHMPVEIRENVHRRLTGFLKPGGHLILEAFTSRQLANTSGGPKTALLLYEQNQIIEDFTDLDFLEFTETTTNLDEGPLHQGEASVIRLFARKPTK